MNRISDEKLADIRTTIESGSVPTVSANSYLKLLLDELTDERKRFEDLLEDIGDPRNTRWTDGFIEGLHHKWYDEDRVTAALAWLCREQAKLAGTPDLAGDIYREAMEHGEEVAKARAL